MRFGINPLILFGVFILCAVTGMTLGIIRILWTQGYRGKKLVGSISDFYIMLYATLFSNGIRAKKKSSETRGLARVLLFAHIFLSLLMISVHSFPESLVNIERYASAEQISVSQIAKDKIDLQKKEEVAA